MTEDDLKAIDQRLAAMSERVDRVIAKESRPMPILKPRSRPRYQKPDLNELRADYAMYVAKGCEEWENHKNCIDEAFAEFERQFDEMAQAHRYRA